MNERIESLIKECEKLDGDENGYFTRFDKEKFAELIIEECMEHALEIGRLNPGAEHTVRCVADRISIKMLGIYPKSGHIM